VPVKNVLDAQRRTVRGGKTRSMVELGGQRFAIAKLRKRNPTGTLDDLPPPGEPGSVSRHAASLAAQQRV
jgi:hypothetical protein